MRSAVRAASASEDFEALINENLALRQELRRRKRRVLLRRVRRGSAVALPVARAISRKRAGKAGASEPAKPRSAGGHPGVAHAAVVALVLNRIVTDARSRPPGAPASPAGLS